MLAACCSVLCVVWCSLFIDCCFGVWCVLFWWLVFVGCCLLCVVWCLMFWCLLLCSWCVGALAVGAFWCLVVGDRSSVWCSVLLRIALRSAFFGFGSLVVGLWYVGLWSVVVCSLVFDGW